MNECCHLPLTKGINCLSSDRSQLTNVSIFGRLTQTVPVVVAFKLKYVLRFKLTARATCRGANKPGSGTKIKLTYDNQRWQQGSVKRSANEWSLDWCTLSVCDISFKADRLKCTIRGYLSVYNCMFSVQNRLPRGRYEYVPDLHFWQLRIQMAFRLDSLSCSIWQRRYSWLAWLSNG